MRAAQICLAMIALLPLGACGLAPPMSHDDRAALNTCRSEADRVFDAQNRYQLSERDGSDSPFSGNTLPVDPNRGLADRYEHARMVDSCLQREGGPPRALPQPPVDPTP